ncbi:MAG: ATP-binding protein, partial [Deltaproteobacteria bacterium]|nr:ATP-binding protein [Deltaproteobacteria bacterium]
TVKALDAFHSGRTELFKGLSAEKDMNSPDFFPRPVISLDMSRVANSNTNEFLTQRLMNSLNDNAKRHKVSLQSNDFPEAFFYLLSDVHEAMGQKAVLLIDEYDAPVVTIAGRCKPGSDGALLDETRSVMQDFYSVIKTAENHLKLAFITGITKFSRMGVFSQLNNLIDISLSPDFSAFMGYTHDELETYFSRFTAAMAFKLNMSEKELLTKISDNYDGFSFDGKQMLFNPFSILSFFKIGRFRNFWMQSGSNTLIRNFLKDNTLTVDQFPGMVVDDNFASNPGEIETTSPEGFLYQSGYLTLRHNSETTYTLDYPNGEVREAISKLFLENFGSNSSWNGIGESGRELSRYLASGDVSGMVSVFARLLAGICYDYHLAANRVSLSLLAAIKKIFRKISGADSLYDYGPNQPVELAEKLIRNRGESYYRSLLHACMLMAGARVTPEKPENLGRLDLEVVYGSLTYVIELKIAKNAGRAASAARAGLAQIHKQGYGRASKAPILVSLAIGRAERNVVGCLFEKDGRKTAVEIGGR